MVVASAAVLLAIVPHLVLSRATMMARDGRVLVATGYEVLAFIAVAWGAARWQRRSPR